MSSPSTTYHLSSPPHNTFSDLETELARTDLDLSGCPPIFVSATHFETEELHDLEDDLTLSRANLTYDILEARIVISKVIKTARIKFDLRAKGLITREITAENDNVRVINSTTTSQAVSSRKRKRSLSLGLDASTEIIVIDEETAASGDEGLSPATERHGNATGRVGNVAFQDADERSAPVVQVVSTTWLTDSKRSGQAQPLDRYIKYEGRHVEQKPITRVSVSQTQARVTDASSTVSQVSQTAKLQSGGEILERAKEDGPLPVNKWDRFGRRRFGQDTPSANPASWEAGHGRRGPRGLLLRQDSTEPDGGDAYDLPEMPEWVKQGHKYACQRITLAGNPNDDFIAQLAKIKLARLLTNDEIGVRAYSTSIAALAAYDRRIHDAREILALPGCDAKIANLYIEWADTGRIQAVEELEADADLQVLRLFYEIWGVGATTAREMYYDRGWRELDDVVEHGWATLSRVQQIGVKFYDEFQDAIPRAEVARIGATVHAHAVRVRDDGIQTLLVGGYRRGKEASGDVDILVSHPDDGRTRNMLGELVASLEEDGWITHTLTLSLHHSQRGQATLPFRRGGGGHGFDSLDKALVVWQDPSWPSETEDRARDPRARNPNIHRRVDIIISPWRTVGCAVVGWSGATTFERDLRRYVKHVHGWKFDSSGVRDRGNGEVVDVEGYHRWQGKKGVEARATSMKEAERRVFESMGLAYREPWERCTH